MRRISTSFKNAIISLSEKEKEQALLKLAKQFPVAYDFLEYNYTDAYFDFLEAKKNINKYLSKKLKLQSNISTQVQLLEHLNEALEKVMAFKQKTKSERLEISLWMHILSLLYNKYANIYGSKRTSIDNKTAQLILKVIKKIKIYRPEATWIEYADQIDPFIDFLRLESPHLRAVIELPNSMLDE